MTQGFWKVYKSKVLQSLGSEVQEEEFKDEGDNPELVETTDAPVLMEEGSNPISQLARRDRGGPVLDPGPMAPGAVQTDHKAGSCAKEPTPSLTKVQGAGARGWRSMSSLFSREDEHKLLTPEPCADHPLALKPAESPPAGKTTSGFWDVFASKWQQASALDKKTAQPEFSEPAAEFSGVPGEPLGEEPTYSNNGSDLQEPEEGAFKWGFLVSKLAEIGNKNAPKGN